MAFLDASVVFSFFLLIICSKMAMVDGGGAQRDEASMWRSNFGKKMGENDFFF